MNHSAGLIDQSPSTEIQNGKTNAHNSAKDIPFEWIFMFDAKICDDSRFVLADGIAAQEKSS
jgi:hypothetical protein